MTQIIKSLVPIVALAIICGCNNDTATNATPGNDLHPDGTVHTEGDEHGHSHDNPPHGGTYADWGGGKYHVEFTVDHDKQAATVYVLGDDAQTALAIPAEEISLAIDDPKFLVALKASPLDGEAEGKSSRFVGTDENLGVVREYSGKIFGTVDGKPYSGDFKEEPHEH